MFKLILVFALSIPAMALDWQKWDPQAFARAKSERKLVILDLESVWCHWCHVMEHETYGNAEVAKLLSENFVTIRVDQDASPELSRRYEDYGWPATVIFDADANELDVRSGYISAADMKTWITDLRAKPTKRGRNEIAKALKPSVLEKKILAQIEERYDAKLGGWDSSNKYLDRYFIEDQTQRSFAGDAKALKRVRQTLDAARGLIDPVWGGAYQYSAAGVWNRLHYEKIMIVQADFLKAYSLAYNAWRDPRDLKSAQDIAKYLRDFWTSPEGAFYTSQDADLEPGKHSADYFELDDKARRAKGLPRIDKHIYSRENGWAIDGLLDLYSASGDATYLEAAKRALSFIEKNRKRPDGAFAHEIVSDGTIYLGDQIAMAQAYLKMHAVTGQGLEDARALAKIIDAKFSSTAGYVPSAPAGILKPLANGDENIALARLQTQLARLTNETPPKRALEFAESSETLSRIYLVSGVLLARREASEDPLHIAVVGSQDDSRALVAAALAYPAVVKITERLEPGQAGSQYPKLAKPAAFVCTGNRCSMPIFDANLLRAKVTAILGRKS